MSNAAKIPFEPVLLARVHKPDSERIDTYLADGGYRSLG